MNKKNIIEYINEKKNKQFPEDKIIDEIENTLMEIDTARNIFNNVDDPRLVEVAIYSEIVAMRRFDHLVSLAKKKGISVTKEYILDRFLEIAE